MNHTLPDLALPSLSAFKSIRVCLEIHQSLIDFFLGVKHERSVLYDFLIEGEASNQDYEKCFSMYYSSCKIETSCSEGIKMMNQEQ
jgi:hypothetical protein